MERPDIPALLAAGRQHGCTLPLDDVTYYVGHETVVHRTLGPALPLWQEKLYAFMLRNAATVAGFFSLPRRRGRDRAYHRDLSGALSGHCHVNSVCGRIGDRRD
jgi:K+ transporter